MMAPAVEFAEPLGFESVPSTSDKIAVAGDRKVARGSFQYRRLQAFRSGAPSDKFTSQL